MALPAPLALFRLEGAPWPDAMGGANLTASGDVTTAVGKFSNGFTYDANGMGTSGQLARTFTLGAAATAISIVGWMRATGGGAYINLINTGAPGAEILQMRLLFDNITPATPTGFGFLGEYFNDTHNGETTTAWHHVAMTAQVGQNYKCWLDGAALTPAMPFAPTTDSMPVTSFQVQLQATDDIGPIIDDVAILPGHVLSNNDVAYLWNGGTGTMYPAAGADTGGAVAAASLVTLRSPFKTCLPPQAVPFPYARRLS